VQAEPHFTLHENNVTLAQICGQHSPDVHNLAIANRGRHTGAASLKADGVPASEQFPADGLEHFGLRAIFYQSH
jgi:hypothetical protein